MFRRVLFQSSKLLMRNFSNGKKPPPGFEKFFKKRDESSAPKVDFPNLSNNLNPKDTQPETKKSDLQSSEENKAPYIQKPQDPISDQKPETPKQAKPAEEKPKEEKKEEPRKEEKKRKKSENKQENPNPFNYAPLYIAILGYSLFSLGFRD